MTDEEKVETTEETPAEEVEETPAEEATEETEETAEEESAPEETPAPNLSVRPICMECGNPIPLYENVAAGYVSPLSDEYKPTTVSGVAGTENVAKVVCKECYRSDFAKKYPDAECPI